MDLFLDTNIYLSFYKLSNDDLEQLKKLAVIVRSGETTLYVTDQVRDEFARKRESVIADSLKAIESSKLPAGFPQLVQNFIDYESMREALTTYEHYRRSLLQEAREAASSKTLHADDLIQELFMIAKNVPLTSSILADARQRFDLGNPPGKADSYGDAVNWMSLLVEVPGGRDLLFVTADQDYISRLDDALISDVLTQEWRSRKGSNITLYKNLSALFNAHYPDIRFAEDLEKQLAVDALVNSPSFADTHVAIIGVLRRLPDLTPEQARSLLLALVENDQISGISSDGDVQEFATALAGQYSQHLDPDEMWDFLQEYGDWYESS